MAKNTARRGTGDERAVTDLNSSEARGTASSSLVDDPTENGSWAMMNDKTHLTNQRISIARKRTEPIGHDRAIPETKQNPAVGRQSDCPLTHDAMARELSEGFAEAARQAVWEAHAEGLAVPARKDGVAVEIRPGGEVVPIDEIATWSPTGWRTQAKP